MLTVYAEGIAYIVALIFAMYLCLVDNLYITMIPIALIIGFLEPPNNPSSDVPFVKCMQSL